MANNQIMNKEDYIIELEQQVDHVFDIETCSMLEAHLSLVLEANQTTNITNIKGLEEARYLHVYDSLLGLKHLLDSPKGCILDIGSGAGYPGVPLVIASRWQGVLIDAVKKKAEILSRFIWRLGLEGLVRVEATRAEKMAIQEPGGFTAVCARAVSHLGVIAELAAPLLVNGGKLIAYKGPKAYQELEESKDVLKVLGFSIVGCDEYEIPYKCEKRVIACLIKTQEPKLKLPRHDGFAQKKPLYKR
ncbi:MAG: 16S rRNA (guanine(527)-N(7))-methyltransferase RsmG [Actinomycetia bacterium]|nr:16S rRNA (guanine(527)-N(7))-methyltransferase RsmG [Actinomycetes bacterium]